jgi:hypothetical protein
MSSITTTWASTNLDQSKICLTRNGDLELSCVVGKIWLLIEQSDALQRARFIKYAVTYFEKVATEGPVITILKHLEDQEAIHLRFNDLQFSDNNREITQSGSRSQPANEEVLSSQ